MRNAFFLAYCVLVLLSGVRTLSMERLRNKAMFQPPFSSSPSHFQSYMEISSKYPILMEIQDDTKTMSSQSSATVKTQQQTKDEAEKQQKALEAQKELERQKALEKMRVEAAKREKERLEALQQLVEDLKRKFNEFSVQIKEDGSQIGQALMESLGSTLQKIRETMNEGYKTVLESISEGNKALQQLLKKTNEEVGLWIRELEGKINKSFCTLKELTVLILKYQKEDNERQIELLEKEIDILKASLPPPLSFCNRYIDCGTCNANPSCGWCSSKNKCIDGDNIGPLKEPCLFYNYDICTGFYCGNYTNCKVIINFCFE